MDVKQRIVESIFDVICKEFPDLDITEEELVRIAYSTVEQDLQLAEILLAEDHKELSKELSKCLPKERIESINNGFDLTTYDMDFSEHKPNLSASMKLQQTVLIPVHEIFYRKDRYIRKQFAVTRKDICLKAFSGGS